MNTQMERYRATRDFGMSDMTIQRGMSIEWDGYHVRVAGRPQQAMPTFKGAIKARWAVPEAEYNAAAPAARPQSAGIKVRPADTGNPINRQPSVMVATTEAEESVVGDYQAHAAQVRKTNQRPRSASMAVTAEPQDGVPVRTLQTLANSRDGVRTTLTGSNTYQAMQEATNVQIEPGRGMTREELLERMSPEQREQYMAEIEARRSAYVSEQTPVQRGPEAQGEVLATLEAPEGVESMGIKLNTTVGGGTDTVDLGSLGDAPAEQGVIEVEGMRFRTTNGPRKAESRARRSVASPSLETMDPRRVIARSICGDFPDQYDFDAPSRRKIARLRADFEDRADVIRAVAAAETDGEVKALLVSEFPEAFQANAP